LAEHFANLLTDASGGTLKSFRSSAKKAGAGLEFGTEWYSEIMSRIDEASDVVALLTVNSIDRPWILYEAGVAKAKLGRPVFGLVIGVPIDQAVKGPFAQFQNSLDDEDSLTKLVIQLIKRNPDAEPREQAVRNQVAVFRESIAKVSPPTDQKQPIKKAEKETADAAKLFEEIKVLFRELSVRLDGQISKIALDSPKRRLNDRIVDAILQDAPDLGTGIMIISSLLRDDMPWIYEAGLDLSRAIQLGPRHRINNAFRRFRAALEMTGSSKVMHYLSDSSDRSYHLRSLFASLEMIQARLPEESRFSKVGPSEKALLKSRSS
jgi:hypothetical protein